MGARSVFRRLMIGPSIKVLWLAPVAMVLIALATFFTVWLQLPTAAAQSSAWVEVSSGEWLRAVRHVPTGRCFVRSSQGGVIETSADVCRP
jgi:hypothetical protein